MRKTTLLAILCIVAGGCGVVGSDDDLSEMSVEREGQSGTVTVVRDGERSRVEDRLDLEPGDRLTTTQGAQAKLRLEGDRIAWIAGGSRARIVDGDTIQNDFGSVLADARDPMTVTVGDVSAKSSGGTFRVDRRTASGRLGVYSGSATLDAPGNAPTKVSTYFQAPITAGQIMQVEPYRLDSSDSWDGLWFEDVVALNNELEQLATGFTGQLGRSRPRIDYFREISQGENVGFMKRFLSRRPADLLIGFTIASNDRARGLARAFSRAFDLREDGAVWGLVATIMRVEGRATVAALENLIADAGGRNGAGGFSFASDGGGGGAGGPTGSDGGPPPGTGGTGGGDTGGDGGGDTGGDGGDDDGDGGGDTGGGDDECEDIVDCIVEDPPLPLPSLSPGLDLDLP